MNYKKKRIICLFFSFLALFLGGIIYCFLRNGTLIHSFAAEFGIVFLDYSSISFFGDNFVRYYYPDFLWLFSLEFGIFGIILPEDKKSIKIALLSLFFGLLFEFLQLFDVLSGTFDILDVLCYCFASFSAWLIYRKFIIRKVKKQ